MFGSLRKLSATLSKVAASGSKSSGSVWNTRMFILLPENRK